MFLSNQLFRDALATLVEEAISVIYVVYSKENASLYIKSI